MVIKWIMMWSLRVNEVAEVLIRVYKIFCERDATMVEINPFAETNSGECKPN